MRSKPYLPPRDTLKFYVAWWVAVAHLFVWSCFTTIDSPRVQSERDVLCSAFGLILGIVSFPFTLLPLMRRRDQFVTWLFRAVLLPICYVLLSALFFPFLFTAVSGVLSLFRLSH